MLLPLLMNLRMFGTEPGGKNPGGKKKTGRILDYESARRIDSERAEQAALDALTRAQEHAKESTRIKFAEAQQAAESAIIAISKQIIEAQYENDDALILLLEDDLRRRIAAIWAITEL